MSDKLRNLNNDDVHSETAIKEVQHLLKSNIHEISPDIVNKLRAKYSDDSVVDAIMESFADRKKRINKVATIFVEAFQRKYSSDFFNMSISKFMKRALKYKTKYNLTNDELEEAKRIFEHKLYNQTSNIPSTHIVYPNTNLSRSLGYPIVDAVEPIKTSTEDYQYLQEIIKLYQAYRTLHSYVVLQTISYETCPTEVINSQFNNTRNNVNIYVHPLLAALFVPKINSLDERMLYANIAGIINTRYNNQRIITKPDFDLFYSIIIDPADMICDNASPMKDLKSRSEVQIQLWNNVYNLRSGRIYDEKSIDFMAYIDKCKISVVDNPDLIYLSDEGVILRRLFSIFAYRPIITRTIPIIGVVTNNPLKLPVNTASINMIPYITYRLPAEDFGLDEEYNIENASKQLNYFLENGSYVPKFTNIIECNGPLIFYIPRSKIALPWKANMPGLGIFQRTLVSTQHLRSLNKTKLTYSPSILIGEQHFFILSVLIYDIKEDNINNSEIIIGHKAIISTSLADASVAVYQPNRAIQNNNYPFVSSNWEHLRPTIEINGTIFIYNHQ